MTNPDARTNARASVGREPYRFADLLEREAIECPALVRHELGALLLDDAYNVCSRAHSIRKRSLALL
jgi:hypothetical protein